jgi:hypothetical protein
MPPNFREWSGDNAMFEVDGTYANRNGEYRVLAIDGPTMSVEYVDGTTADLKISIQERIWENIVAEREASEKKSSKRSKRKKTATVNYYIKVCNVAAGEELAFPGWEERVVMAPNKETAEKITKGDRLIYYSPEAMTFFAVATVTGDPFEADPKKYTFTIPESKATFFQIDVDADTGTLSKGVTYDSVELESSADLSTAAAVAETFITISEDDFELLSEVLAEISEDEDEEVEVDEEEAFEEDED